MEDKSKKILVTRSSLPPLEEYVEKLEKLWESAWLTNMGDFHQELKEQLFEYLQVEGIELFVNGHTALEMVIQAFQLKGEVITTPFSFVSTTHAIVRNGLEPVFCDINPKNFTIDAEKIEDLITAKTCAIIPTHVYGHICDVKKIEQIAKKHGLVVIYDAAHAFGEQLMGTGVGNFGDASMFSFHATKVFHSIEGGAVTYHNPQLTDLLYQLKNFGITGKESVEYIGGNGKMNEFQAAMGLCNLKYLQQEIGKRRKVAMRYRERLDHTEGIYIPAEDPDILYNYAYFPVVFDEYEKSRDEVYDLLAEHQIYTRKYFYPCINDLECYRNQHSSLKTPVAKEIADHVLTLPIYADLELEIVDQICDYLTGKAAW